MTVFDQTPFTTGNAFGTPNDFAENPEPRCACVLLLDTSGSMWGDRIRELNNALAVFKDDLVQDSLAVKRVELTVVTFGGQPLMRQHFVHPDAFDTTPLETDGNTPFGAAVNYGLDLLEERKAEYRNAGIAYYRPWLFVISDGAPTDEWQAAAARSKQAEADKKVAFFSVGVTGADMEILKQFSARPPIRLHGLQFKEMFLWLSKSMSSVSSSRPDEKVALPVVDWGSV